MTLETKLPFCNDFMVVIDTNCFENYAEDKNITPYCACIGCDEFLKNRNSRPGIPFGKYFITESVFGEILQQRKEYYIKSVENLKKAMKPFGREPEIPLDINFEADLKQYLSENNIEILPHPDNSVFPKIIKRALEKKSPFKLVNGSNPEKGSDKGFKDVLLWETLLSFDYEKNRIGKIFLITRNSKDFPEEELLPEWHRCHPLIELKIITEWKDFVGEEKTLHSELIAQNNIDYSRVLDLFQGENSDIVELPNFKKKVTGKEGSPIVEIETDVKKKDGTIYSTTYFYDIRVNEPTLVNPEQNDDEQEVSRDEPMAEN